MNHQITTDSSEQLHTPAPATSEHLETSPTDTEGEVLLARDASDDRTGYRACQRAQTSGATWSCINRDATNARFRNLMVVATFDSERSRADSAEALLPTRGRRLRSG